MRVQGPIHPVQGQPLQPLSRGTQHVVLVAVTGAEASAAGCLKRSPGARGQALDARVCHVATPSYRHPQAKPCLTLASSAPGCHGPRPWSLGEGCVPLGQSIPPASHSNPPHTPPPSLRHTADTEGSPLSASPLGATWLARRPAIERPPGRPSSLELCLTPTSTEPTRCPQRPP